MLVIEITLTEGRLKKMEFIVTIPSILSGLIFLKNALFEIGKIPV